MANSSNQPDQLLTSVLNEKPTMDLRTREEMLAKVRRLTMELETEEDTMQRLSFGVFRQSCFKDRSNLIALYRSGSP